MNLYIITLSSSLPKMLIPDIGSTALSVSSLSSASTSGRPEKKQQQNLINKTNK